MPPSCALLGGFAICVYGLRCCGNIMRTRNVSEALCLVIFRVRRSRGEMYTGHGRLCVCMSVCLSVAAFPHYLTNLDVTWGNGSGAV